MQILEVITQAETEILRVPLSQNGPNRTIPVLVNPGRDDLLALSDGLRSEHGDRRIRGIHLGGNFYFWDGYEAIHGYVGAYLEWRFDQPPGSYDRITVWPTRRGLSWDSHGSPPEVETYLRTLLGGRPARDPFFSLGEATARPGLAAL